jgi:DNA-binding HxlR family transcriptional regulator
LDRGRFAQIRDTLPGVSEKVLTAQLKELQQDGVIRRLAAKTIPPEVSYELTDAGGELVTVMEAMCAWGIKRLGIPPKWPRPATSDVQLPEQTVG